VPATPTGLVGARVQRNTRISWNASDGAANYLVQAATFIGGANLFDSTVGNTTSVGTDALDPSVPLFVRVFAVYACGAVSQPTEFLRLPPGVLSACVPDPQTMCLFDGRFVVSLTGQLPGAAPGPALVTRRFNDGGGFAFQGSAANEDLFMRVENRCATSGAFVVSFDNRSAFPPPVAFTLFVGDLQGSISRQYVHAAGVLFTNFQDPQSFSSCP
jgi:hypothetical protein